MTLFLIRFSWLLMVTFPVGCSVSQDRRPSLDEHVDWESLSPGWLPDLRAGEPARYTWRGRTGSVTFESRSSPSPDVAFNVIGPPTISVALADVPEIDGHFVPTSLEHGARIGPTIDSSVSDPLLQTRILINGFHVSQSLRVGAVLRLKIKLGESPAEMCDAAFRVTRVVVR